MPSKSQINPNPRRVSMRQAAAHAGPHLIRVHLDEMDAALRTSREGA